MSTLPQVDGFTDVVVLAQWLCAGADGEVTAEIGGSSQFTISADDPNYTPYADLTQEQVLGWVFTSLGENGIDSAQQCVQGQINSILTPPVSPSSQPLPWSN
jgi:hypothetical protein